MSQRFKVGDTVYPVRPENPDESRFVAWTVEMNEYAGKPATVTKVDTIGHQQVYIASCVGGKYDDEYYFLPAWLTETATKAPLDVGDFVHYRCPNDASTDVPWRGRVIGVGERKLAIWPDEWRDDFSAKQPLFINREWVVSESDA